jgi:SAM-dependent methyltransferase
MKSSIVKQLNQLNHDFYTATVESFDATRQQPWQGWLQLSSLWNEALSKPNALCFDIGCGNGRFAVYVIKEVKKNGWKYVGLDNSVELLEKAQIALQDSQIEFTLTHLDIINSLHSNQPIGTVAPPTLITVFGLLHHIPSFELRLRLFQNLKTISAPTTKLVITTWQCIEDENLMTRKVEPEEIGIPSSELEKNDYILTWERAVIAKRYCHYTSDKELELLATESGWHIEHTFAADGKSNTLNHYFVLSPTQFDQSKRQGYKQP